MFDLITAIATPPGAGGIGIIRISGNGAANIAAKLFPPNTPPLKNNYLQRVNIITPVGALLDKGMAVVMAPGFTGEEVVELHCHGSPILLQIILDELFKLGVRHAEPGEFTKRAFLNGRLDLTAAEAIHDLITAPDRAAAQNAVGHLNGLLAQQLNASATELTKLCAHFYAFVDYPDDDISDLDTVTLSAALEKIEHSLTALAATHERGQKLRQGTTIALVGAPNAGKSSLLNALLGYERAIVSPIAGTTRDTVSEQLSLGGRLFKIIDTAGIRDTHSADHIEALGIERSLTAIETAEMILYIIDATQPSVNNALLTSKTITVCNKSDLLPEPLDIYIAPTAVYTSALTGSGLDELVDAILDKADKTEYTESTLITNARQASAVQNAAANLTNARHALLSTTPDVVISELESALSALHQVTGRNAQYDILDAVFENFCVGK